MKVWDTTQIGQFLVAAQQSPWSAFFYMAVTTGMRQAELLGLKWSDLSWTEGTVHVQRQMQRIIGHRYDFVEPKTKSGRRVIKLGESTLQTLRLHKERQEVQKLVVGARWKDNDLIFPTAVGTPGDASNVRKEFKRVIKEAGLPAIRFHDLRHSAASLLLNNNVPLIVIANMLGHSRPSTTLDIYGHLYHESQNEAAKLMDRLVAPIPLNMVMNSGQLQEGEMLTNSDHNCTNLHQEKRELTEK
jgi:integrase